MNRIRNFLPLVMALLVGAAILGMSGSAHAGFSLKISDGTNTVVINDNAAGTSSGSTGSPIDLGAASGQIIYAGAVGVFDINITTGTSNAPGTPTLAQLTINDITTTTTGFSGTQTLTFTLEDDGF